MSDRVYLCSTWLSSIIDNLCNNVYKIVKRDTSVILDKLAPKELLITRNRKRELTEIKWRRVRRQVASECCERPCTVGNIIMYCPEDAKLQYHEAPCCLTVLSWQWQPATQCPKKKCQCQADAVAILCNSGNKKRAEDSFKPWNPLNSWGDFDWTRFKRTGLTDECCLNPCTTSTILSYC